MKITVFSPHLDDAVLNVCDHILVWQSEGHDVRIVTLFTTFSGAPLPRVMSNRIGIRSLSPSSYRQLRKREDIQAMRLLNIKWHHMDYVDAGFRSVHNTRVYSTYQSIFSGNISSLDAELETKLQRSIDRFTTNSICVIPLGVGKHVDHLLTRKIIERISPKSMIWYYIDYPYALRMKSWSLSSVFDLCFKKRSILSISTTKKTILACYKSQVPRLFNGIVQYSEIILTYPTWCF